jgi:hypothetical protein
VEACKAWLRGMAQLQRPLSLQGPAAAALCQAGEIGAAKRLLQVGPDSRGFRVLKFIVEGTRVEMLH